MTRATLTHPAGGWTVDVAMLERDRVKAEAAAGDVPYQLRNAAAIFDLIQNGISGGWLKQDIWLIALAEVSAKAFREMAEKEGVALEHLHRAFRLAEGQNPPTGKDAA